MKNDFFEIKRFFALAAKDYSDNRRWYFISISTLLLILLLTVLRVVGNIDGDGFYKFMGFTWLVICSSKLMGVYSKKQYGVNMHMLPATDLEKFVYVILNSLFLYLVFYCFFAGFNHINKISGEFYIPLRNFKLFGSFKWDVAFSLFILSISLWLTTVRSKMNFKNVSIFTLVTAGIILFLKNLPALTKYLNVDFNKTSSNPKINIFSETTRVRVEHYFVSVQVDDSRQMFFNYFSTIIVYAFLITFLTSIYFKFREQELK